MSRRVRRHRETYGQTDKTDRQTQTDRTVSLCQIGLPLVVAVFGSQSVWSDPVWSTWHFVFSWPWRSVINLHHYIYTTFINDSMLFHFSHSVSVVCVLAEPGEFSLDIQFNPSDIDCPVS